MDLIRPLDITESILTAINVPEDDAPAWAAGTYAKGDQVILEHVVYESLTDSNSDTPDEGVSASPPTWARVGASRPWRLFDNKLRSVTRSDASYDATAYHVYDDKTAAQGVALTLSPGQLVDGLALLNLSGLFAHIKVENAAGVVYEKRVPLSGGLEESNWHSYFYTPIERRTQVVLQDLPKSLDAQIHVAIEDESVPAQVGEVVLGRVITLGDTRWGARTSIIDYSKKDRDEFGSLYIVERRYTKVADFPIQMPRSGVDTVYDILSDLRAQPALYIGALQHSSLVVFGIYRDMNITFENHAFCDASIEVEEI